MEKKIGIEINGQQHYGSDGKLTTYFQERHDLIESEGWKLLELHYSVCYNEKAIEDILKNLEQPDYTELIKMRQDKHMKKYKKSIVPPKYIEDFQKEKEIEETKQEKQKTIRPRGQTRTIQYELKQLPKIEAVKAANIDFSKFGWVHKVSEIIGISEQKCGKWSKRFLPEIYETAFKTVPNGTIQHFYCTVCGKEGNKPHRQKELTCKKCSGVQRRVVQRPSKEALEQLLSEYTISDISRMFEVSRGSIRKWCIQYGIEFRKGLKVS